MKQREPKRNPHNHDDPPRRATQSLHYRAHIPVGGKSPRWHVINKIAYARHAQPVEEQTPELPTPSPGNRKTPPADRVSDQAVADDHPRRSYPRCHGPMSRCENGVVAHLLIDIELCQHVTRGQMPIVQSKRVSLPSQYPGGKRVRILMGEERNRMKEPEHHRRQ